LQRITKNEPRQKTTGAKKDDQGMQKGIALRGGRIALLLTCCALAAFGLALWAPSVMAQSSISAKMRDVLPDAPKGWSKGEARVATGALPMYSIATAEAVYRRGGVEVIVGAGRSPTLYKAVMGSVKDTRTLPPDSVVETIQGRKAIASRFPNADPPLYSLQILAGVDGIIILRTRNGVYEDLLELAKGLDFDPFPER
jgi:hypothetical protein